jgi:mRNA interferase RelE/StbE
VLDDPRRIGAALTGSTLGNYWKYRVGDYRIIADIQDRRLCVQVVRLGNRREIYR